MLAGGPLFFYLSDAQRNRSAASTAGAANKDKYSMRGIEGLVAAALIGCLNSCSYDIGDITGFDDIAFYREHEFLLRNSPSLFQAWNGIENRRGESEIASMARHDLVFSSVWGLLRISWQPDPGSQYRSW